MSVKVQDVEPLDGHSPAKERPIGGYATLMAAFAASAGGFAAWVRASDKELPERLTGGDLALMTIATHKASRLISKDRVTSAVRAPFTRYEQDGGPGEVTEKARGQGLRRAIGELLVCPYCIGLWVATAFAAGFVVAPRQTRWAASVLTAVFGSDVLQIAYKKAEDTL